MLDPVLDPVLDPPLEQFHLTGLLQAGFLSGESGPMKLGEIISRLQAVYTDKIGVEYMHIWDHEQVTDPGPQP